MMRKAIVFLWLLALPMICLAGQASVKVQTAPLKKHQLEDTITAFGLVRPNPEAQTTRNATYTAFVQKLDVTLGEPVQKGQPLLTLQTAPTARANYLRARTNVRYARQAVTRQRKLLDQRLATHANVNSAEQTLAQAKAELAAQKELGTDRKTRVISAPFTGIVSRLPINSGNQVQAGTVLFQLARRDRLQVALGIEPDEVARLQKDMPVQIISLFGHGQRVATRIHQINAVVDPNTRLVNAIVPLAGAKAAAFMPGMRVRGEIRLVVQNTLAVPRSAVLHDDKGDYLFVVGRDKAHRVNVTTGIEKNGRVAIKTAKPRLKLGQPIVIQGNYELSDGMAVRAAP